MITYKYQIVSVTPELGHMEIEYSSEGKDTILVGTRLPDDSMTLDQFAHSYVPAHIWLAKQPNTIIPEVGTSNTMTYLTMEEQHQQMTALMEEERIKKQEQDELLLQIKINAAVQSVLEDISKTTV